MDEEFDDLDTQIGSDNESESEYNEEDQDLDYTGEMDMDTEDLLPKDEIPTNIQEDYDDDNFNNGSGSNVDEADDDNDEVDDDDEDEINSTKKIHLFNKEVNQDYIKTTHPECLPINMDELKVMLPVIRNANGIIIDDFHTTIPILTKYEKTRVIGQRASMIEHGAKPFISVPSHVIDSVIIAEMELNEKKIPFIIKRPLPNNGFEYWRLSDLELII